MNLLLLGCLIYELRQGRKERAQWVHYISSLEREIDMLKGKE
jgi:hypothetical protein